jgi:hypothetical protein
MTPLLYVAIGFVIGAAMVYFFEQPVRAHLEGELAYYRKELATAQDRLVHAWREDRAVIPPRPVPVDPPKPLPPELLEAVNDWESPEARASAESQLRNLYFDKGWGVMAILKHLENQHP